MGDVQFMHFRENDDGPFWLTPAQRLARKNDRQIGANETKNIQKNN